MGWERIGADRGFRGRVGRATLSDGRSVIVKIADGEGAAIEARFYEQIDDAPAPHAYHVASDGDLVVLVLEDLTSARAGDELDNCSVDDATSVLAEIEPFHARWRGKEPGGFPRWADRIPMRQASYDSNIGVFFERFGHRLPLEAVAIAESLQGRLGEILAPLVAGEQTLIHGDLHLDNVLFDARPDGRPVIVDWQTAKIGPAALDLVMFTIGSLSVADRRSLGQPTTLTLDEIRRAVLSMWAGIVGWLARPDLNELSDREQALAAAVLNDEQYVSALLDYGTSDLLAV